MWLRILTSTYVTFCIFAIQISFSKQAEQRFWQTTSSASKSNFDSSTVESVGPSQHLNGAEYDADTQLRELSPAEIVIEKILTSNRQGRNLEGYDEIYADPEVKNALQVGNDTLARSYIRDKLCFLGLMNCDGTEERRPFYSPHHDIHPQDVIYAQPITIKPIGRPLPAIPVKRPVDFHGSQILGNEPRPIYSGPSSPLLSNPSYNGRPPFSAASISSFPEPHSVYKKFSTNYFSKPVYEPGFQSEIDYEDKGSEKKQIVLQDGSNVQQHVHHHFHHNDGGANAAPAVESRPIVNSAFNNHGYGNGGNPHNDIEEYKKNFQVKTSSGKNLPDTSSITSSNSYADRYVSYEKPNRGSNFVESNSGQGLQISKQFNLGPYNSLESNNFGQNSYRPNHQFEANTKFSSNNNFLTNNEFSQSDNRFLGTNSVDCVCVPYSRCTTLNQAGRKDDIYLAIDPRNIGKNIEADTDQVVVTNGNGTLSIIQIPKKTNETEQLLHRNSNMKKMLMKATISTLEEKRAKRNVENTSDHQLQKDESQSRRVSDHVDATKFNLKPTLGISFGLPQGGVAVVNPYEGDPLTNPYSGYGIGHQGINLGLLSVNPLVAIQVTKDDYGEKIVKPFVNFHLTPNQEFVRKIRHFLSNKKQLLFGSSYAPDYYPSSAYYPSHNHGTLHFEKPHYQNYHRYHHHENQLHSHYGEFPSNYQKESLNYDINDYDYTDYEDDRIYYRNSHINSTEDSSSQFESSAGLQQKLIEQNNYKKVTFPERRKRKVEEVKFERC